jgi:hypothetical protein
VFSLELLEGNARFCSTYANGIMVPSRICTMPLLARSTYLAL